MRRRRPPSRAYRQPPPQLLISQSRRRPGRGRPRWLLAWVAVLLTLGAVAVVASATNPAPAVHGRGGVRASAEGPVRRPSRTRAARRVPAPSAPRRPSDDDSVNRVLGYTSFLIKGGGERRVIALTFDDGPGPYTEQIIQILTRMHAPATFFIVGQELNYFSAGLRDEHSHGFAAGDHTENHLWLSRLTPAEQYGQIRDAAIRMQRAGAPFPRLFRPPYGIYDHFTLAALHALHMLMVLWSIDPGDWRRPGTGAIVDRVLLAARPGGIVELHDGGGDRSETVAALPAIIAGLRRRHYQLVTIPELLRLDPPPGGQQLPRVGLTQA